jgi:hypothetical protein
VTALAATCLMWCGPASVSLPGVLVHGLAMGLSLGFVQAVPAVASWGRVLITLTSQCGNLLRVVEACASHVVWYVATPTHNCCSAQ